MGDQDITLTSTTDTAEQVAAALGAPAQDNAAAAAEATAAEQKTDEGAAAAQGDAAASGDAAAATAAGDAATSTEPTAEEKAAAAAAKKAAAAEGGKAKAKLSKRIDELVRERNEARGELTATKAEVEALRGRVAEIIAGKAEKKADADDAAGREPQTPPKPKQEDFSDYDEYLEARDQWVMDRAKDASKAEVAEAVKQALKQREEQVKAARQEQAQTEARERYQKSVEAAMARYEDFEQVVNQPTKLTHVMYDGMLDSEIGGDIAYYLSTHDDVRKKLFDLGETARAIKEFGKIESLVEQEIKKLSAGSAASTATEADDDDADDGDEVDDQAEVAERRASQETAREAAAAAAAAKKVATKAPDPMPRTKGGASAVSTVPADQLSFREYKERRLRELKAAGRRL